ncbi:MAG TPA: hypothetical protein DCZ92_04345 [Elusimicrobia bacterium]|nr:hypothetical protein [Elusimicrobiota bacterium]
MITEEWKTRLRPAEVRLIGYFVVPLLISWLLGGHDNLGGGFAASDALQAGFGVAVLRKLFAIKEPLAAELARYLGRMGQPQQKTLELTDKVISTAGYLLIAALLLPPFGRLLPHSRLVTLAMMFALAYTVYMSYFIWKLSGPFLDYVPAAPEPEPEPEAPAAPVRLCAKCGQQLDDAAKACAFCKQPAGPLPPQGN